MKEIASHIYEAFENGSLAANPFENSNQPNELRKALVQPLALNAKARGQLVKHDNSTRLGISRPF